MVSMRNKENYLSVIIKYSIFAIALWSDKSIALWSDNLMGIGTF